MLELKGKIDYSALHGALSATYKRQMELKKELANMTCTSLPMYSDYKQWKEEYDKWKVVNAPYHNAVREKESLSFRMTILCCILNHSKNRLHMHQYMGEPMTLERQSSLIEKYFGEFLKQENAKTVS